MAVLNFNIGILGHVDSGKTSLAKVLSSTTSTACFDKNPQSQERGITVDLGFSSLLVEFPKKSNDAIDNPYNKLQYTFVDCPGHASLIRTIIGGAQIIDTMILVVDITKGIQTQTAECLVIGEILCPKMIVVLNKIDQIEEGKRDKIIEKMTKKIKLTLEDTVFRNSPVVCVAANPANGNPIGMDQLITVMGEQVFLPERHPELPIVLYVDHCFSIRGQGTVMTGTLWQGTIKTNDVIEIPSLSQTKKVKSIQIFRKNVGKCEAGERVAVCVTQFDPKLLERGLACSPGHLTHTNAVIASITPVRFYRATISSGAKFHFTIGHETVIGKLTIFCHTATDHSPQVPFNIEHQYLYCDSLCESSQNENSSKEVMGQKFALIEFEKPILVVPNALYISSKLDMDVHTSSCRIAFFGQILETISDKNYRETVLPKLHIYKNKSKFGSVDRIISEHELVCKDMFKKETKLDLFTGLKVKLSTGEEGTIEGCFGQSGKIRVSVIEGLKPDTLSKFVTKKTKRNKSDTNQNACREDLQIELKFKQYIFAKDKKIIQCQSLRGNVEKS